MIDKKLVQGKNQKFAKIVFENVQAVVGADYDAKYKTLCKRAGGLIRNSGLIQTLAFFKAKGQKEKESEKHHIVLYDHLQQELQRSGILPKQADFDLFQHVLVSEVPEYMYLTQETLKLLNWHRRLAETLITSSKETNQGGSNDKCCP